MQYINTETGEYPLDLADIQEYYKNTSLPPDDFEPPEPFARVLEISKPECDKRIQQAVPDTAVCVDGIYYQSWKIVEIFSTQEEKNASIAAHLQLAKDQKIKIIKDKRARLRTNGVFVNEKWFQTDTVSRSIWAAMLNVTFPSTQWVTLDDSVVTTSPELAMLVFQATAQQDVVLANNAQYLILSIDVCEDPETVDIESGWPQTYVPNVAA